MMGRHSPTSPARRLWLFAFAGALVSGCAQTVRLSGDDRRAFWSGRLLLQVQSDPRVNITASFELTGSPESGELNVLSPFGHHLARLQWSRQRAQLQRGQDLLTRPSLDALVYELTGTELPLPALFQWLAGQPADAPGWQIDLAQHAEGRISAQRMAPAPVTFLRIVLDR
jgi:outer membrane lipoprotein LolB